ncbi:hypothetical protein FA09DRAFT_330095 [Tilletiopsis washingtonensis]|uniref:peptidylprolyl isomerase n=1 Tax=Tilletiopsis washingtonensis TaxID=58919 RepID=A0A316Z825_9BASI|nr:hypothetical protein FA09DRAFT_330095 [Tilletiopsis washingtonensis]PWN97930.1 hypothetical protein FA09DRAFT_330095 [Tilletiopsis washingtonensis]
MGPSLLARMACAPQLMRSSASASSAPFAARRLAPLAPALARNLHASAVRAGVEVKSLSAGDGKTYPKKGDKVTMHYVGTLQSNGSKFDSSRDRGSPFVTSIGVGQVIKGWDEGVPQLSLGEKAVLTITPDYGYGARGFPPVIPANSTLIFEVELLKIN